MGCLIAAISILAALLLGVQVSVDGRGASAPGPVAAPAATTSALVIPEPPGETVCGEFEVRTSDGQAADDLVQQTRDVLSARLFAAGLRDSVVDVRGDDLIVEAQSDEAWLRRLISAPGQVAFVPVPVALDAEVTEGEPVPAGMTDVEPLFTSEGVAVARAIRDDSGLPVVDLTLSSEAAKILDEHAAGHQGERFAIVIDGVIRSAPVIRTPGFDGRARISGDIAVEDLVFIAALIAAGPLPAPLEEVRLGPCG